MKKLAVLVLLLICGLVAYLGWWRPAATPEAVEAVGPAAPATAEIARVRSEARARGEIDVSPCSAGGRIVDRDSGRGVEGALVQLRPRGFGRPTTPDDPGAPLTATTDAGGSWSIAAAAPGRYVMTASAPEHLPGQRSDVALRAGHANSGLDLTLERGGHPLRGTVTDISGGPVEGAVIAVEGEGEGNMINFSRTTYPAISDAEGRFVVQVRDGLYSVSAWHPDYTGDSEAADVAGGPRSVALRLTPAATIEGVVRAAAGGAPVEGALIRDGGGGDFGGEVAQSDAGGRFRLAHLKPGAHALTAAGPGHATSAPVKVELGIGESLTGVEIVVDPARKITGFVVPKDDPSRSLDGVMVAAYSVSPMQLQMASAPSGVDGYFEIFGVKPGTYTLGSVAEEALPEILGGPSVTIEAADVTGVVIALDRGVEIKGRVEPAGPASISLTSSEEDTGFLGMLGNLGNLFVRGRADARGEFTLRPVKAGALRVVADAPDGAHGQVDVAVGERGLDGVVVVLEPRAAATGRVTDARGAPLRSGSVEYQPRKRKEGGGFLTFNARNKDAAPIAEDGSYTLRGLDGGEYDVRVLDRAGNVVRWADAEAQEFKAARKTIAAAVVNTGLDFTVEVRDGVLRGVVVGPDGAPLADAWVTAAPEIESDAESMFHRPESEGPPERVGVMPALPRQKGASEFSLSLGRAEPVLTGEDGRFELTGLARRTYTLRAEGLKGSARVKQTGVALASNVRLQVVPLAELVGVVRVGGAPVTQYELKIEHPYEGGTSHDQETVQRKDGAFTLDHREPGKYILTAIAAEGRVQQEIELAAGERRPLTLDLQPWARLRGLVIDERTGAPIAGVSLTTREGGSFQLGGLDMLMGKGPRTDASGRFELAKVMPGTGTLQVVDGEGRGGHMIAEAKYDVVAGGEQDLGTLRGIVTSKVPKEARGVLGVRLVTATAARRPRPPGTVVEPLKQKEEEGAAKHLFVLAVTIDGAADKAGVQPGDAVKTIDGNSVASIGVDHAEQLLAPESIRAGQRVELALERDGDTRTVTIEAAAPAKQ